MAVRVLWLIGMKSDRTEKGERDEWNTPSSRQEWMFTGKTKGAAFHPFITLTSDFHLSMECPLFKKTLPAILFSHIFYLYFFKLWMYSIFGVQYSDS